MPTHQFSRGYPNFCLCFFLYFCKFNPLKHQVSTSYSSISKCDMIRMRGVGGSGGGSGNLERVMWGMALGEEVASVKLRRTHNLHGNSLIFLSPWLSGSQHTRWQSGQVVLMTRGGEGRSILGSETAVGAAPLRQSPQPCHLQILRAALIGLAMN